MSPTTMPDPAAQDQATLDALAPALIAQFSLTGGLLLFIRDLWLLAPLDHALMTAGGVGAVLYAALMVGWTVARHALAAAASADAAAVDAPAGPDAEAAEASEAEAPASSGAAAERHAPDRTAAPHAALPPAEQSAAAASA